jgi:ubiquinone/menaquinone biosynthesis C-methylase UbiE
MIKFHTFFSQLQEAPWYREFLNPVIEKVEGQSKLLDIGTGSGKMVQILTIEKGIECTGIDTNAQMLAEAKKKLQSINVKLMKIEPNQKLPFGNDSFDYVTICSVLFHLKKNEIENMLNDVSRILKPGGSIVILTPTGEGSILKLTRYYFSIKNIGIYIWYNSTKPRAQVWYQENYLAEYSSKNNLKYTSEVVMNGFAQIEVITL